MSDQSYYKRHVFFCLNQRSSGEASCGDHRPETAFEHCKARVKSLGLTGKGGVRINKAGCLDRCAGGPVAVVYPEAVWYSFVDEADLDEIIERHLQHGEVVTRLVLDDSVGR